jgi:kynurenine formamidase
MQRPYAIMLALAATLTLHAQPAPSRPLTRAEFERAMTELSNWNRWGKDDELGTMNLVTPARRKAAAALVTEGVTVSLSRDLNTVAAVDNGSPFVDKMNPGPVDGQFNMDEFALPVHGFGFTHLDALSHAVYQGKMYNGVPESAITPAGATRLSVGLFASGIVGRGVLVDIPRLKGLPYLEPGTAVFPSDLDAWEKKTGIRIGAGDIVLVRTGRWAYRAAKGPWDIGSKAAGLDASCARWLKQRDIGVFGSDAAGDVIPSGIDGVNFPLHPLLLVAMGTPMLDQCDLEEIAKAAAARSRWTFFVTAAPLRAAGGTGSPVNIIAMF